MGELVDDAIVDVENIFRRLRGEPPRPHRPARPLLASCTTPASRSAAPSSSARVVVILVFLPLFALSGIEGRLFTPLGIAYIVSILASLVVSLTVTPVLSYYLLPTEAAHRARRQPAGRAAEVADARLWPGRFRGRGRSPWPWRPSLVAAAVASVPLWARLPARVRRGLAVRVADADPGTSLAEANRLGFGGRGRSSREVPEVSHVGPPDRPGRAGRARRGVHSAEIDVDCSGQRSAGARP